MTTFLINPFRFGGPLLPIGTATDWRLLPLAARGGEIRMADMVMAATIGGAQECTGGTPYRDFNINSAGIDSGLTVIVDNDLTTISTMGAGANPHTAAWGYQFATSKTIAHVRVLCGSRVSALTCAMIFRPPQSEQRRRLAIPRMVMVRPNLAMAGRKPRSTSR